MESKKKKNKAIKHKDAVEMKIVKKKGKIISFDEIPYTDDQIGYGWVDNSMLTEEESKEKKKMEEGLNMKDGRDVIIFLRRLTKGDKIVYIKSMEEMILSIFETLQFMEFHCDITIRCLNEYQEIIDRLPKRIKSIAMEKKEIDMIKMLKKSMKEIIKPVYREQYLAERPTVEQIRRMKILHFEGKCPDRIMEEVKKTEKMTDNEYVAYKEQQRKELIKAKRNLMDDLLKKEAI